MRQGGARRCYSFRRRWSLSFWLRPHRKLHLRQQPVRHHVVAADRRALRRLCGRAHHKECHIVPVVKRQSSARTLPPSRRRPRRPRPTVPPFRRTQAKASRCCRRPGSATLVVVIVVGARAPRVPPAAGIPRRRQTKTLA